VLPDAVKEFKALVTSASQGEPSCKEFVQRLKQAFTNVTRTAWTPWNGSKHEPGVRVVKRKRACQ